MGSLAGHGRRHRRGRSRGRAGYSAECGRRYRITYCTASIGQQAACCRHQICRRSEVFN
jgi:hypothetical protein